MKWKKVRKQPIVREESKAKKDSAHPVGVLESMTDIAQHFSGPS